MDAKKNMSTVSGLAAAALLIPGLVMAFKSPAGVNAAVITLAALHIAAIALSLLGAVFSIARPRGAAAVFTSAGAVALLCLLLTLFMLLSIEVTVILTAASAILVFAAARTCSGRK